MWKSIRTFISLFYLDFYFLLLSLEFTIATEKAKLTLVNVKTVFFKKWNDLFWALVSMYWLGSESANINKKSKTDENSTTLIIFWNSSGGWGCNNFNNASNAHWQNSSASKALLNGLVQFSQCVLTKILPVKYFFIIKLPLFVECRLHITKFHYGILSKQHLFKMQNFAVTVLMFR